MPQDLPSTTVTPDAVPIALVDADGGVANLDGWENVWQQFGIVGRDPTESDEFGPARYIEDEQLRDMYRGDPLAARMLDLPAGAMVREGWEIRYELDGDEGGTEQQRERAQQTATEAAGKLMRYGKRLGVREKMKKAIVRGWLYGGAIVVVGADDTAGEVSLEQFAKPLGDSVKTVSWLRVIDRRRLAKGPLIKDPRSPFFGEPEYYKVTRFAGSETEVKIHRTRCLVFPGAADTYDPDDPVTSTSGRSEWDESVLARLHRVLADFAMTSKGLAIASRTSSYGVFKMEGLASKMAGKHWDLIAQRMQAIARGLSILNAAPIDAGKEDLVFGTRSVTGLGEAFDRQMVRLSAARGIPMTVLFGVSPGGFGTGEHEEDSFAKATAADQEEILEPQLERLYDILELAADGPKPPQGSERVISFRPLDKPSRRVEAETRKLIGEYVKLLIEWDVITAEEAATSLFGGEEFSMDIVLDLKARAELAKQKPTEQEQQTLAELAAKVAALEGGGNAPPPSGGAPTPGTPKADPNASGGQQ